MFRSTCIDAFGASIFIGVSASLICNAAVALKARTALDDTLDVFPCHGVGGMVGMIMTGVLAQGVGLAFGKTDTFLAHVLALVLVAAFAFVGSYLLLKLTDYIIPLRVSDAQEELGLDISSHGEQIEGLDSSLAAGSGHAAGRGLGGSPTIVQ